MIGVTDSIREFLLNNDWEAVVPWPDVKSSVLAMELDLERMASRHPELATALLEDPTRTLTTFTSEVIRSLGKFAADKVVIPRFVNIPHARTVVPSALRVAHIDRLCRLRAKIRRAGPIEPRLLLGTYWCQICGAVFPVRHEPERSESPSRCDETQGGCGRRTRRFKLILPESVFVDGQPLELVSLGGLDGPSLQCTILHADVGKAVPGNEVTIGGIVTAKPSNRGREGTVRHAFGMRWPNLEGIW